MSKLEKFKRRLIRSVAALQLQEKKSEDELWEILREKIGRNCRVLWERMRALTVKKLRRLLAAEDRIGRIPKFAQMSDTDWLFFDLLIAHEDEDVIGREDMYNKGANSKVLTDLFTLVQRFNIEALQVEKLPEAWTAAALLYNSSGHQCSPMLMQRRWYQLKQCTRQRFYDFWFAYRGSFRYWNDAQAFKPNELQQAIADKYPHVITAPFLPWEELIKCGLVVLADEFESCKGKTDLPKPCDENSPDLLFVEPVIETIDLEEYISDEEKCTEEELSKVENSMLPYDIKIEPEDTPIDNNFEGEQGFKSHISVEVMDSLDKEETLLDMSYDVEALNKNVTFQESTVDVDENEVLKSDTSNKEQSYSQTTITKPTATDVPIAEINAVPKIKSAGAISPLEQNISKVANEDLQQNISEPFDHGIPKITNVFSNVDITNDDHINSLVNNFVQPTKNITEKPDVTVLTNSENETVCGTINVYNSFDTNEDYVKHEISAASKNNKEADVKILSPATTQDSTVSNTSKDNNENMDTAKTKQSLFGGLRNYFDLSDEVIELVDDGIEYVEDDELEENADTHIPGKIETEDNEDLCETEESKFDLKLLMQTTVYTTKLNDMKVFKDKSFHSVNGQSLIDSVIIESKPSCFESLNVPNYMNIDNSINNDILIEDDNNEVEDIERVELSSNLLKKPRNRTYNPIQLCKNPDFNTRLKWLTVGFLSSSRNRFLLKLCKPLTIDISKAFESKLVNGTIYLKNSDTTIDSKNDDNDNNSASVVPSAMSVQSLIDNMVLQTLPADLNNKDQPSLVISFDGSLSETNKIVCVTDTNKTHVANKRLLTADVTPFQIQTSNVRTSNLPGNITNQDINTTAKTAVSVVKNTSKFDIVELDSQHIITGDRGHILKDTLAERKDKEKELNSLHMDNNKQFQNYKPNAIASGSSSSIPNDITNKTCKAKSVTNTNKHIPWRCYIQNKVQVSWLKAVKRTKDDGALITIDTLHKMLSHIDGTSDIMAPVKNKAESRKEKRARSLQRLESKSKQVVNNDTSFKKKDTLVPKSQTIINNFKNPKVNVLYAKRDYRRPECCWARSRINLRQTKLRKFCFRHTCKRNRCNCCCKNELKKLLISIRNEKALKSACESIESVVQQTRQLFTFETTRTIQPITETLPEQTQIDTVDLSEDLSDNEVSDVNKPTDVTTTECNDSNKDSVINDIGTKCDNVAHVQEQSNGISIEIDKLNPVDGDGPNNQNISQCTSVASSNCNKDRQDSVQTIEIVASTVETNHNNYAKLTKQNLSIHAKNYSQKYIKCTCKQLKDQPEGIETTDNNKIKQIISNRNSKEKILILNRKQLLERTVKNSIYLGKNKILVTNINIPSQIKANEQTPISHESTLSETTLPKGVQLMLSPTGELMCNLLPGAEIDTDSLSRLPTIMAAVQTHLNVAGESSHKILDEINISGDNNEKVLDLCENNSIPTQEITMEDSHFVSSKSIEEQTEISNNQTNIDRDPSSQVIVELEQEKLTCQDDISDVSTSNKQNIENTDKNEINPTSQFTTAVSENLQPRTTVEHVVDESSGIRQETISEKENSEEKVTKTDCEGDSLAMNRKTLLSDLMEMSGISAEDVTSTESTQQEIKEIPPLVPFTSQTDDFTVQTLVDYFSNENNITTINLPTTEPEGENQILSFPHLSMITSFSEIKYACKNNGLFFKLDYKTGNIVPITVCIKKTNRPSNINSECIIDLTDERDNILEEHEQDVQKNKRPKLSVNLKTVKANPLRIFKANRRPIILKNRQSLLSKTNIGKSKTNSLLKSNVYERDRKMSHLNKNKEHTSLINSDTATEIIGAVNGSDDDNARRKRSYSSDSSDDEPLICKVKRKKNNTENKSNENESNPVEVNERPDKIREASTNAIPDEIELVEVGFSENDITADNMDESITLSTMLDHADVEEDCILGV